MLLNTRSCTAVVGALLVLCGRDTESESSDNLTKPVMALKLNMYFTRNKSAHNANITPKNSEKVETEKVSPGLWRDQVDRDTPPLPVVDHVRPPSVDDHVYIFEAKNTWDKSEKEAFTWSAVCSMTTASSVEITLQDQTVIENETEKKVFGVKMRSGREKVFGVNSVEGKIIDIRSYEDVYANPRHEREVTVSTASGNVFVKMSKVKRVKALGLNTMDGVRKCFREDE